ncbi:MAG TPA: acetamidase/formamidase family protein [Candidatus Tectomicrobia bacterium]|nr:acetamidase/formamidase family protein [Candidatus Tectomicrobia bacterium]
MHHGIIAEWFEALWHPDIPPVPSVDPGDTVVLETRDAVDGAVTLMKRAAVA